MPSVISVSGCGHTFTSLVICFLSQKARWNRGRVVDTLRGVNQPRWNVDGMRPTTIQRSWRCTTEPEAFEKCSDAGCHRLRLHQCCCGQMRNVDAQDYLFLSHTRYCRDLYPERSFYQKIYYSLCGTRQTRR